MKRLVVGGAVLALGVAGMGLSQAAPSSTKVTGGGQVLVPDSGPGDTIAFTGQTDGSTVKGQFNYVAHTADNAHIHGDITCVAVYGDDRGAATLKGVDRATGTVYRIDVIDNGSGQTDSDIVEFGPDGDNDATDCTAPDQDPTGTLGRGNVTIHKEK